MEVFPNVGIGPLRFGMNPAQVLALFPEEQTRIYLGRHHRVWGDREQMDPDVELAKILGMSRKEITASFDVTGEIIEDDDDDEADK